MPGISWEDDAGKTISDNEKYSIEDSGRVLVVRNLEESDEKQYTCIGSNKFDSVNGRLYLNVTCTLTILLLFWIHISKVWIYVKSRVLLSGWQKLLVLDITRKLFNQIFLYLPCL